MWRNIPRPRFPWALVLPSRAQRHYCSLVTTAAAFPHCEKLFGLKGVDELAQPSSQAASRALGRDIRVVYNFNDIVVTFALVLWHCVQSVLLFHACVSGLDKSWRIVRCTVVQWHFRSLFKSSLLASFPFSTSIRIDFKTCQFYSWCVLATGAFDWQTQDAAMRDFSTGTVCHAIVNSQKLQFPVLN